jgi:catechol 2,3-dioxygenase
MFTHTLNVTALLRLIDGDPWLGLPAATRMGHIHLHVADLAAAEAFYADTLGLDVTTRRYPGALFLAAGGYHHHVAVNVWARGRTRPADATVAGLDAFDLVVPDAGARAALVERLHARGTETAADGDATRIADPENNRIRIRGPA